MDKQRIVRRVLKVKVSGGSVLRTYTVVWLDGWCELVKVALDSGGITVEDARQCAKDMKKWRTLVHM